MTIENVPTLYDGTARYNKTVALDGINFIMYFSWNSRDEHWYVDVHDGEDIPISGFASRKLVGNWPASFRSVDENRPDGLLYVVSDEHDDPLIDNLGLDTILHYIPEEDLAIV